MAKARKKTKKPVSELDFPDLVSIVKGRGRAKKDRINAAYNEIEKRLRTKFFYVVYNMYIPGYTIDDMYQEALVALRFKAIPDYKRKSPKDNRPFAFDTFALLCVRRHLSTLRKTAYQNKKKTLNCSMSINQDRNDDSEDSLFLSDILISDSDADSIAEDLGDREYYHFLFSKLFDKLSKFEKKVFLARSEQYSYEEICNLINKSYEQKGQGKKVDVKSIDNALSRIKGKAKIIFAKYKEE